MSKHVLALLHGMIPNQEPLDHSESYAKILKRLRDSSDAIDQAFPANQVVQVEYCHRASPNQTRDDQLLQPAQSFIFDRVGHKGLEHVLDPEQNGLSPGEQIEELLSGPARLFTDPIKERLLLLGMSDAVFYASQQGEDAVRATIYKQILEALEPIAASTDSTHIHIIAHSLGATVAFDFLFGLFAPDAAFPQGGPSFLNNPAVPESTKKLYKTWRERAAAKKLQLGSFSTAAGQLPILLQRSVAVIQLFAKGNLLEPHNIGIPPQHTSPKWRNFFDRDDVLGFPCRPLFTRTPAFEEYQVNAGTFLEAHQNILSTAKVLKLISQLIESNLQS